jgi:hypothetical protein
MNSTVPMPYIQTQMPYIQTQTISNTNNSIPYYAQTRIPINPIGQMPMQIPQVPMVQVPMPFGQPLYAPYQPDIIKKYNINVSTGDLGNIKHIYQDMLPKNNTIHDRYATIIERFKITNYYGLIFNKHYYEYNELNKLIENKKNDLNLSYLLGHIKINYFNSYFNNDDFNLIQNLTKAPKNFIMFNVCFPIKYDNNIITCAEDSLRAHMRIYKLFDIKTKEPMQLDALNKVAFELLYYKRMQELIKKYEYPNFVLLYGVFIAPCKIDFDTIEYFKNIDNLTFDNNTSKQEDCLLMLTESVNYNIIQWMTKQYVSENDTNNLFVSKVTSTGVRSVETWKSVIFQLLVAIYILDLEKIGFKNFSLKDNVYIKKIDITPPVIKYWKYIIDGNEYYVPNHGFLVMIDSNFSDDYKNDIVIDKATVIQIAPIAPIITSAPKITSTDKYDYDDIGVIDIKTIIKTIFNNLINLKTQPNVSIPDDESLNDIFNNITASTHTTSLKDIINNNFNSYLYEKIGHIIPESELNNYNLSEHDKNFKPGDLVIFKKYSHVYIISVYKGPGEILTNNSNIKNYNENKIKLVSEKVSDDLIVKFSYTSTKEVIETYNIR